MGGAEEQDSGRGAGNETRLRAGGAAGTMLLLALVLQASPLHAVLIDRVVAAVNMEVITWSELRQAIGFNRAMGASEGDGRQLASQTLEGIINRKLLRQEARRLRLVEVAPDDVAAETEKLKGRFGSEAAFGAFLAGLDMTLPELSRMLEERLIVERFVEKKIGLLVRVSHEEARAFFEGHPDELRGKRFPEVRDRIVATLMVQKVDREVDGYLAGLRSRAEIRINTAEEETAEPRGNGRPE